MSKPWGTLEEAKAALAENRARALPLSRWRHRKTGHEYQVHGHVLIEATLEPAVIYYKVRSVDPSEPTWCRPASEFFDGRFECIKP